MNITIYQSSCLTPIPTGRAAFPLNNKNLLYANYCTYFHLRLFQTCMPLCFYNSTFYTETKQMFYRQKKRVGGTMLTITLVIYIYIYIGFIAVVVNCKTWLPLSLLGLEGRRADMLRHILEIWLQMWLLILENMRKMKGQRQVAS